MGTTCRRFVSLMNMIGVGWWLLSPLSSANAQTYTVRDLGQLATGDQTTYANGINSSGNVAGVGSISIFDDNNAFKWTASTNSLLNLGTLGASDDDAVANNLNDSNVLVGKSVNNSHNWQAFSYNGSMTGLAYLTGGNASEARAINASGVIVGWSNKSDTIMAVSAPQAVRWSGGNISTVVSTSWLESVANDISSNEYIVGYVASASFTAARSAFIKNSFGIVTMIPKLTNFTTENEAFAVNSAGIAVGVSKNSGGAPRAFIYRSSDSSLSDLGSGTAVDINNKTRCQIVGYYNGDSGGFYYDSARGVRTLSSLVPSGAIDGNIMRATSINDVGQITVTALKILGGGPNFQVRSYVLTPCLADFDENFTLNATYDFAAFDTAYKAGNTRADLNFDGQLTTDDYTTFWSSFFAGCS